jgi:site-specific DNA recombinase
VGSSRRMNTGTCDNKRKVAMPEIESRVLTALREHLLPPEIVATAVEAYRVERERPAREHARSRAQSERDLAETKRRIVHVVDAIETGADPGPLIARLNELEAQRRAIEVRLQRGGVERS